MMLEFWSDLFSLSQWVGEVTDPRKRLYWGYLLTAILVATIWLRFHPALPGLWRREVWLSASARADYKLFFFNKVLFFWLRPNLLTQSAVALSAYLFLMDHISAAGMASASVSPFWQATLFTLCLFIVDDFSRFLVHWLMHRVPWLWWFHRVHHSAEVLNPFTVLRTHPVEGIVFTFRSVIVQGVMVASFLWLFGDDLSLQTVLGANVFVFVFHAAGSNLRHSPVPLWYPEWLEKWLLSPAQHQLHHSVARAHYDKNFGVVLACWDRWFRSWHRSERLPVTVGVNDRRPDEHRLQSLLWYPFSRLLMQARQRVRNRFNITEEDITQHEL